MCRAPLLFLFLTFPALGETTDDFADGDDAGWIHFDPIALAGGGAQVTFEESGGFYQISAPVTPNEALGRARGAALRPEIYTDFCITIDIPRFDILPEQAFGILARVQPDPGPGDLQGYAMTYHPTDDDIQITRIENEEPIEISQFVFLSKDIPEGGLRLVFFGTGETLVGRAYDPSDPRVPLAETITADDTHVSGFSGIVIADNSETNDQAPGATFDNYFATGSTTPPQLRIVPDSKDEYGVIWEFPFLHHFLEEARRLDVWENASRPSAATRYIDSSFQYFFENAPSDPKASYFRIRTEDVDIDDIPG